MSCDLLTESEIAVSVMTGDNVTRRQDLSLYAR